MSLKTWLKEFYPTDASVPKTDLEAIEHSLKKWIGLSKKNLNKHNLLRYDARIYSNRSKEAMRLSCENCSLCRLHLMKPEGSCSTCPITTDKYTNYPTGCMLMWYEWVEHGRVAPMISALRQAKKKLLKEKSNASVQN